MPVPPAGIFLDGALSLQSSPTTHHAAADEPSPPSLRARGALVRFLSNPIAQALVLFGAAWLFYLAVGAIVIHRLALTGDEPWYVAQGYVLVHDHSPNLAPVAHDPQYISKYLSSVGSFALHIRDYRGNGELLLPNLPGYGLIVGASYLLAGRWGIVALQAAFSALTVVLICFEARRVYRSRASGLFAALAFLTALPAMLFTAQIFPSSIASALTFLGFVLAGRLPALLEAGRARWLGWAAATFAVIVALLPWLHFKYALVSVALVGILLLRLLPWLRGRLPATRAAWSIAGAVTGGAVVSFALIAVYCHRFFGTWLPQYSAANGGATDLAHPDVARALALFGDIFLSQQSGLLPWVPLTLLVIPGVVVLWRRRAARAFDLLVCVAAQLAGFLPVLFTSAIYQGYALPSRFTAECAPFFALAAAGAFAAGEPTLRSWWDAMRARTHAWGPAPSLAAASATPPASSTPRWMVSSRQAGALLAAGALCLLLAGAWFSAVGLRTAEFLYPSTAGNRIVERYTSVMPGWWFALFPDPEAINPYIASMPFGAASPAGMMDGVPVERAAARFLQGMPPGAYLATFRFTCAASASTLNSTNQANAPIVLTVEQIVGGQNVAIAQTRIAPAGCAAGQALRATLRFESDGYDPIDFRVEYPAGLLLTDGHVDSAPVKSS